jgi:hypothetical protein
MELRHRGTTGDDAGRVEDIRVTHEESNHILGRKPEGLASIEWRFDGPDQRDRPGRTVKSVRPFFHTISRACRSENQVGISYVPTHELAPN